MKFFVTLVDELFGKQFNNITKNPLSDVADALDLPLYLEFQGKVYDLFIFSEHIVHVSTAD